MNNELEDINSEQLELWEKLKNEVPNSSFMDNLKEKDYSSYSLWLEEKDKNITCFGWF